MLENIKQAKIGKNVTVSLFKPVNIFLNLLQMNWLKCNRFKAAKQGFGLRPFHKMTARFNFKLTVKR